jgi:hypothetical protein
MRYELEADATGRAETTSFEDTCRSCWNGSHSLVIRIPHSRDTSVLTKLLEHAALVTSHAMPHAVYTHGQATMRVIVSLVLAAYRAQESRDLIARIRLVVETLQGVQAKVSASHASDP